MQAINAGLRPNAEAEDASALTGHQGCMHQTGACHRTASLHQGKSAARRATSVKTMASLARATAPGELCIRDDETTGRKSPGSEAESATPKGEDPPAPSLPLRGEGCGPGAACRSDSPVASGDATHQLNGAYSRADAPTPSHRRAGSAGAHGCFPLRHAGPGSMAQAAALSQLPIRQPALW